MGGWGKRETHIHRDTLCQQNKTSQNNGQGSQGTGAQPLLWKQQGFPWVEDLE